MMMMTQTTNSGEFRLSLPLYIELGVTKTKRYYLNLNTYRNLHFQVSNQLKKAFTCAVGKEVNSLPVFKKIRLTYTVYYSNNRLLDVANIGTIVDKFFCDALIALGKIEDDNYLHIPTVTYTHGGVDRDNPRVEVTITKVDDE